MSDQQDGATPEPTPEEELDAVLAEIVKDDPEPEQEQNIETQAEAVEPEVEDTPSETEPSSDAPAAAADPEDLDRARDALRRDGFSYEEVDQLLDTLGQDKFLRRGLKRAKAQADADLAFGKLQDRSKEGEHSADEEGDSGTTPTLAQPSALNLKELAQPLADQAGLDDPEALVAFGQAIVQHFDAQRAQDQESIKLLSSALHETLLDGARRDLGYGESLTPEVWTKVRSQYEELAQTKMHADMGLTDRMRALLKAAVLLEAPDAPSPDEIQRKASVKRAKKAGVATVASRKPKPAPMSSDDKLEHMLQKIVSDDSFDTPEEAAAYARKL